MVTFTSIIFLSLFLSVTSLAKTPPDLERDIDQAKLVIRVTDQNAKFFCERSGKQSLVKLAIQIATASTYVEFGNTSQNVSFQDRQALLKAIDRLKNIPCKK